jgi:hypothetical protein
MRRIRRVHSPRKGSTQGEIDSTVNQAKKMHLGCESLPLLRLPMLGPSDSKDAQWRLDYGNTLGRSLVGGNAQLFELS